MGESLVSNVRRLLHAVIRQPSSTDPEVVISLDAEKVFNRVEWESLFTTVIKYRFEHKISFMDRFTCPHVSVHTNNQNIYPHTEERVSVVPLLPLQFIIAIKLISVSHHYLMQVHNTVLVSAENLLFYITNPAAYVHASAIWCTLHLQNEFQ